MSKNDDCDSDKSDVDIEDLHLDALRRGSTTYTDPSTGFVVFSELAHLKRGTCCGNQCRHCPYGWVNVSSRHRRRLPDDQHQRQLVAKVESGNPEAVQALIRSIQEEATQYQSTKEQRAAAPVPNGSAKKTGGRHGGRLTEKNVPYTRTGDKGTSQLLTGERRSKTDVAFEAMGAVDELCSVVGVVYALIAHNEEASVSTDVSVSEDQDERVKEWLLDIMSRLFDIGSHVAKPKKVMDDDEEDEVVFVADGVGGGFDILHVQELEDWIDILTEELPELRSFILPTGHPAAAHLHVARTVCRRAERVVVPLVQDQVCDPNALHYLNRLSDFLFSLARWTNGRYGQAEIQYRKASRSAKQRNRIAVTLQEPTGGEK